jgi:hypothetical protein
VWSGAFSSEIEERGGQTFFSTVINGLAHLKATALEPGSRAVARITFSSRESELLIFFTALGKYRRQESCLIFVKNNIMDYISLPDYRRAIVLNNIGVSLLERQAYAQAMDTLKDAICIMKQALCTGQIMVEGATTSDHNVDNVEKVNTAYRLLLATSYKRESAAESSPVDTIIFDKGPKQVTAAGPFLCSDIPHQVISPIRIEIIDSECLLDRDADLDSALMLYNYALAHVAMAECSCLKKKYRLGALALFDMATTVIMNGENGGLCFKCPGDNHQGEQHGFNENRLVISFIITSNRVRVLMDLGDFNAAKEMTGHLGLLGEAVMDMMSSESEMPMAYPAAAA